MSEKIDVRKIARLARLKLKESEEEYFEKKFNEIMEYVGSISEVNTESDMKEKDESLQRVYRDDLRKNSSVPLEEFSPHTEGNFFKTPKVIE